MDPSPAPDEEGFYFKNLVRIYSPGANGLDEEGFAEWMLTDEGIPDKYGGQRSSGYLDDISFVLPPIPQTQHNATEALQE